MSDQLEAAKEIQATLQTPGWKHIEAILDEQILEPKESLFHIMAHKADTLTGKKAISLAARASGLSAFKEEVYSRLKILTPTRKGGS